MAHSGGENIAPGLIQRLTSGVRFIVTGANDAWFGPQQPVAAVAPQAKGRGWDYPFGVNLNFKPKVQEGVTFQELRNLADGCDIVRSVIETRKDQIAALRWGIAPRDEKTKPDETCAKIEAVFRVPDGENDWGTWTRMILEDMFVIDAATVYPRLSIGGEPLAFEVMDGATIKRLLNPDGRTPLAPDPAYQQILKGVPAVDYSADELIYRPRNRRSHRSYGLSHVEQILTTINVILRKDLSALSYYTQGTVPDGFLEAPPDWNPDQVALFQKYFDDLMAGNLAARRGAYVLPGKMKYVPAKDEILKDEMYEWLARIVCYVFSVPPTPFVKQVNRATAQTAQESAEDEGLSPLKLWLKSFIDFLIVKYFRRPDLEFRWADTTSTDPLVQAKIDAIYLTARVKTPNEVRMTLGLDPLEGGDDIASPSPNPGEEKPAEDTSEPSAHDDGSAKLLKKKDLSGDYVIPRDYPVLTASQQGLEGVFTDFLGEQAKDVSAQASALYETTPPESSSALNAVVEAAAILEALSWVSWDKIPKLIEPLLIGPTVEGGQLGLANIHIDNTGMFSRVNETAAAYAKSRAAELIGKKWVGGELVDNPDARWAITQTTRDAIRDTIEDAFRNKISAQNLAAKLEGLYAFSPARAALIARTEVVNASVRGNMIAWRESGVVVGKRSLLAEEPCQVCRDNAAAGVLPLDTPFPSGDDAPVYHPRCECSIEPITDAAQLTAH